MDPVCGIEVDERTSRREGLVADHEGTTYYFCSSDCHETFQQFPTTYAMLRSTDQEGQAESPGDQLSA
jgi:YHS domain-containing protein